MERHKKTIFTRHLFIDLAKECGLNAAIFEQLGSGRDTEIVVDNDTLKMLVKLQEQFAQLEEMGDNEYRGFYIELPRPTQEEWGDCEASIADGEYESTEEYLRDWELSNPRETVWYHVSSARYRENRTIQFTDRKHSYFTIANYSRYINRVGNNFPNEWQRDFLAKLTLYFHKLIDTIIQDPEEFNDYVANHLPYQQRDGKIARKEFNRIEPRFKIEVEDETTAIKALEDSVCKNFGRPLDTMTIRSYCKYYRIAHEAYGRYFERFDTTRKIRTLPNGVPLELQDVAYYNMVKFCDLQDKYALDSETDFNKFASDHYGELGLLRLNILASDFDSPGWRIIVSNSYSAYVDVAVEVATALYKSGAPLEIHDAAKLLRILKEKDHVKLIPYTFHDYMGHHEEGTVYQLPWEYECMDSEENVLSLKQYHDIISLAEWDEIEKVKTRGLSEFYFSDDKNQDIHDLDGKSENMNYEYGAKLIDLIDKKNNIYIVEIKNKLSIGDKLEVLYTDKLDVGSFEIEELYDVDTNQEIPTINPGKKGQKVKIKIPFENLKSGIVIRRKK